MFFTPALASYLPKKIWIRSNYTSTVLKNIYQENHDNKMNDNMKKHWNEIYELMEIDELGWYEKNPIPSLNLLSKCNINKDDPILDIGCGATTFIDCLIKQGFRNIIGVDISEIALSKLKARLKEKASLVKFIVDDITQPVHVNNLRNIAVWHDRALLHFLLEE